MNKKKPNDQVKKAIDTIGEADALLITAGAGMGVDSGLPDFRGPEGFWKEYPVIAKLGHSFVDMANPGWFDEDPWLAWAFYGHRLSLYRKTKPHSGFSSLLEIGKKKSNGYFVLTSNVDGHFQQAGFDDKRIEECHGSIHHFQCSDPCTEDIWSADDIEIKVDETAFKATGALPTCQKCKAVARPNILMFYDGGWVEKRTQDQDNRLWTWIKSMSDTSRLVIVEIGAGTTVSTIRQRSEYYADLHFATLIRINPRDYHVPKERHISLPLNGLEGIQAICGQLLE
jgi:NAD-dependent SIR2 family protein deacetylase